MPVAIADAEQLMQRRWLWRRRAMGRRLMSSLDQLIDLVSEQVG